MKTSLANAFALVNSLSLTNPNILPVTVNVFSWWKFFSSRCATQTGGATYEIVPAKQRRARNVQLGNPTQRIPPRIWFPKQRKGKNRQPRCPTWETPPTKFLCRKREGSNFVKFQERNSWRENRNELLSTKLHLSNLHSSDRKTKNFHPRNSTHPGESGRWKAPAISSQVIPPIGTFSAGQPQAARMSHQETPPGIWFQYKEEERIASQDAPPRNST